MGVTEETPGCLHPLILYKDSGDRGVPVREASTVGYRRGEASSLYRLPGGRGRREPLGPTPTSRPCERPGFNLGVQKKSIPLMPGLLRSFNGSGA